MDQVMTTGDLVAMVAAGILIFVGLTILAVGIVSFSRSS